jgi:outer membrane protein TolC
MMNHCGTRGGTGFGTGFNLAALLCAAAGLLCAGSAARAQNPSSALNPFYGSVTAEPATDQTLKLSLDEAIARGLKNNLGLKEAEASERALHGQKSEAVQMFLPTILLNGSTGAYQHDLIMNGFSNGTVKKFASLLHESFAGFSPVMRDTMTDGRVVYSQTLFSGPVIAAFKAAGAAEKSAYFDRTKARGEVVQQVATVYLHAQAAASEVENARALVRQAQLLADHAHAAHEAGVVANLDELRAQVELKSRQQALIAAENAYEKNLILLKREIGVAPGQAVELTDPAPYNELARQTPAEVRAVALKNRQDYQSLQNQVIEAKAVHQAYRLQRLPSLSFNGYYAVSQVSGVGANGNFAAVGTVSVPLFREASLRGDVDSARAQMQATVAQLADLRGTIDAQVRMALLDVDATSELVRVARSNVDLATRTVSDETDRVSAGVDDNLPLVTAQASLASAESNLVESLYQFNVAKLALARSAGVLEQQYRDYLGR